MGERRTPSVVVVLARAMGAYHLLKMRLTPNNAARARFAELRDTIASAEARLVDLDHQTLDRQMQLAQIPAPTGREAARAGAVAASLRSIANNIPEIDAAGNVVAKLSSPGTDRSLAPVVCMAHLDTVFSEHTTLQIRNEGSRVYCPGIGDNSRGLAAMIAMADVARDGMNATNFRRPIEFVATVGEEGLGNLRGAHAYFATRVASHKPSPHAVLVIDGPGDANIVHHALGSRRYHISFGGAGGHSWVDFGAPNAVHAAARATAWLADVPRTMNSRVALTVSSIGGGESMNAIPANAFIEVDVRATDETLLRRVDVELRKIVAAAAATECTDSRGIGAFFRSSANQSPMMRTEIYVIGERPCGSLDGAHPLVQIAREASAHYGIESVSAVASTDANVPLSLGIPAITIGAGGIGGGAHTVDEWYDNTHGARGIARAFAILAALAA